MNETADTHTGNQYPLPRVLAIGLESSEFRSGGLNRYFAELVDALTALAVPIVGLISGDELPPQGRGLKIVGSASASMGRRMQNLARAMALHGDVDVVDTHFALTALPVLFGRLRRKPMVVHFQGPWADESALAGGRRLSCTAKRLIERAIYRQADAFVVLSNAFRRILIQSYGVSPWNIHAVPPGVSARAFAPGEPQEARSKLDLPKDAFVALAVRRLVPRMGLDVLLDAWARVASNTNRPVILCIVGEGSERGHLEALRASLGLGHSVRFLGHVDDKTLGRYYQAADVSVVPSIALEGFGLVVLESLATGTPVIASDLDGLSDALEGLAPGLLVPPGDAGALAVRLTEAIHGVQSLPSPAACRAYAQQFSWERVALHHLDIYRSVCASKLAPPLNRPRQLRVVILGHTAELSGGELAIARTIPSLSGVQVHVVLAENGPLVPLLERAGASVEVLPMPDRSRRLRRSNVRALHLPVVELTQSFVYVARLARRLKVLGPDVVHTNTLKSALYGGAASRIACIPCIWHIRDRIATDYLPPTAVRLVRLAAKSIPSAIIANSQTTLDTLRLKPNHRNRTVHDSVVAARDPHADTSSVIPSPVVMPPDEVSSGNAASQFNVGMIGRIAPWKGQDVFLRAFAKAFSETEARATLVGSAMFGEDGYETELRDLVQNLGIADRVEFRGFREDVFAELQRVDVLVHASVLPEPFGQVVVEGMAAGLPVVAARAGGPAEILIEGETGLLYSPGDVDELAMILRRLANDRQLRQELGMRGRAAAQMFSPERVAHQILDVYRHTVRPAQC